MSSLQWIDARSVEEAVSLLSADESGRTLAKAGGMDLLDLCTDRGPATAPLLVWLIEATPCSLCCHGAYERLVALGAVPAELAEGARHDSNDETRALFA